jgi:2-phospho-L-lactate guanylyltransferase
MSGATIVIPFRSLTEGKSRLSNVLDPIQRVQLNQELLERVVRAVLEADAEPEIVVVSPDREALDRIAGLDPRVEPLWQPDHVVGLNPALEIATARAIERRARTVAILPADLPLIRATDIDHLLRRDAPVVIAPDRRRSGTNGLMQRIDATRGAFRYRFGPDSYRLHQEESHRLGLDAATAVALGISFDLDTPDDLDDWTSLAGVLPVESRVGCG